MSTQTIIVLISIAMIFAIVAVMQRNRTKPNGTRDNQDSGDA